MTSDDRLARQGAAGRWLRAQRENRGYSRAVDFARALGVDPSLISNYERGVNKVDDDRAEQIAEVLGLDLIEVRRNLGLWVPDDPSGEANPPRQDGATKELLWRMKEDPELVEMIAGIFRRASRSAPSPESQQDDRPATG